MAHALKDLLNDAVKRARIGRQVDAVNIVEVANDWIKRNLPTDRQKDARAISYKNGTILIMCLNSAASFHIGRQKDLIQTYIKRELPQSQVRKIATKVTREYPSSEV